MWGHQQTCIGLGCFAFSQEESSQWLCKMRKMVQKSDFVPEHSNFSTIPWVPVTQPCHMSSRELWLTVAMISSHSVGCLFMGLIVSFAVQKLFNFMSSSLSSVRLISWGTKILLRKFLLMSVSCLCLYSSVNFKPYIIVFDPFSFLQCVHLGSLSKTVFVAAWPLIWVFYPTDQCVYCSPT